MDHSVRIIGITQTPWLIDDTGVLKNEIIIELENDQAAFDGWFKIDTGKSPALVPAGAIAGGAGAVTVCIDELDGDGDVLFTLYDNPKGRGGAIASRTAPLRKVRHWTIYVAHDMHTDIGYTDHPEELIHRIYPGYLDEVFQYIQETNEWPEADRFRYPVEASFMLYASALAARNADWLETLKKHLADGRITYPYDYVHIASEGMGAEEIARQNYVSARLLPDMLGTGPRKTFVHTDDAGFSWANIDSLADAGCRYLSLRLQDANWNYTDERLRKRTGVVADGHCPMYPRLFYLRGRLPGNKLLTFDGPPYHFDDFGFRESSADTTAELISWRFLEKQTGEYPYDAYLLQLTKIRDNFDVEPNVMRNIHALNQRTDTQGRRYVYPRFVNSTVDDFFAHIEKKYGDSIPSYQGTLESFWNFGAAQVAHETAISRANHENVPAAEYYAAIASVLIPGKAYPYEDVLRAYDDMLLSDEHTWARWYYSADDPLFIWGRNKPIEAQRLSERITLDALSAIAGRIAADGPAIAVFNHTSQERTDIVKIDASALPRHFSILDLRTGNDIPYQHIEQGVVTFIAGDVPALGYRCYGIVSRDAAPGFPSGVAVGKDTIENRFFRVTLDRTGSIASIIDKRGGVELVDSDAPHGMNQFVYYTSRKDLFLNEVYSEDSVRSVSITASAGPVMGMLTAEGTTRGADMLRRRVILYDALDRIDIVNEIVKSEAPPAYWDICEEGFFTFPFRMERFTIRHETPNGEIRPHVDSDINQPTDQLYWSNTDFYTVNRWIDISDETDRGVTFSPVDAPLVQYGGRRTGCWDKDYEIPRPWVYSWVYNNLWSTCYPFTQPGPIVFRYSIRTHPAGEWQTVGADRAGIEAANGLRAALIPCRQDGSLSGIGGQFLSVDCDHVRLTALKPAEANGEGIILRFQETAGADTRAAVRLSGLLSAGEAWETDIAENDREPLPLSGDRVGFEIQGRGWKTVRLKAGIQVAAVGGVIPATGAQGTLVRWDAVRGASFYEIFRGADEGFLPEKGHYIATVSGCHYLDRQVPAGLKGSYWYRVRACSLGGKGDASAAVKATPGVVAGVPAPPAPRGLTAYAMGNHRVTVSWERSPDTPVGTGGYRLFRDGRQITDVPASVTSWLDVGLKAGTSYTYSVRAYDGAGRVSDLGETAEALTSDFPVLGNIAPEAEVSASSELTEDHAAGNVTDGLFGVSGAGEWIAREEHEPWVKLAWPTRRHIDTVHIFGPYDPGERVILSINRNNSLNGILTFSDGSFVNVNGIKTDGSATVARFDPKHVTWIKLRITSYNTKSAGLAEIQVFEKCDRQSGQ